MCPRIEIITLIILIHFFRSNINPLLQPIFKSDIRLLFLCIVRYNYNS